MPRLKIGRELAHLVIEDLAKYSGLTFKHPDRLTYAEVTRVSHWAQTDKNVQAALRDHAHEAHDGVKLFETVVRHFVTEHPQGPAGDPEPWPDYQPTGQTPTAENPFADLTAEQAEARLIFHGTKPGYRAALKDPNHPDHAVARRETEAMRAVRYATTEAPSAAAEPDAAALADIKALDGDPAYQLALNEKAHGRHQAALDRRAQLYERAYDGKPVSAPPAPNSPDAARARISELRTTPAFQARLHAFDTRVRQTALDELAPLYDQAYPEPAAGPAPEAA